MDRPAILLLGVDCRTGLQSARLFAARNVDVYGVAENRRSPYCRTRALRGILDAARFLADPVEALRAFAAHAGRPPVLLPCTDRFVLWLNRQRDVLAGSGRFVLGKTCSTETLVDKGRFARLAIEHGLPIPQTRFVRNREDAEAVVQALAFPLVIKPSIRTDAWLAATDGRKVLRVETPVAFRTAVDKTAGSAIEMIVQEWIPGSDRCMYSVYSYRTREGEITGHVVVQKLRQWPPDTGVGSFARQVEDERIATLALDALSRTGYAGLSSVQVKRHSETGIDYLIEVNAGRPALNMPLAEFCGVELQMSYYCEAAGMPIAHGQRITHPGGKWICWKTDLASAYALWRRGDLDLIEWWQSLSGRKAHAVWSPNDPVPFMLDMWRKLSGRNHRPGPL